MELNISQHARERFAERIMDKQEQCDIANYVNTHTEVIDERIAKMVEFGEEIYHGKSISEYNKSTTKVYLKDTWVIIVDPVKNKVITLYNIDLGLDDEFNKDYVNRLMTKLDFAKEEFSKKEIELMQQKTDYENIISQNETIINENNRINNELKKQNDAYKEVIAGLETQVNVASQEIKEIVGTMVGRKTY